MNQRATHSDDSISEKIYSRGKELSSFVQSDSDEVSFQSYYIASFINTFHILLFTFWIVLKVICITGFSKFTKTINSLSTSKENI